MPDKPHFHPNERVDLSDMTHASAGYTDARSRFDTLKHLLGKRARLLEGFRVEIVDQATSPGQIAVHNGTALDSQGRPLNNEAQVNDSRDITLLGASQSFFIEIEYRESESSVDGRGFWDPSFDNVAPDLDGKEFGLNATTRITPNWQIVTPVSTTGFGIESDPASTRVPVAVLSTTAGGLIDEAGAITAAFSKVVVSNVFEEDHASGVTEIRVLDSRLFGDTGTVDLDFGGAAAEILAFTSNNRTTGVLGLGAPTSNAHQAGEIVRINGSTATFVSQRTGAIPTLTGMSEPDAARRLYQGDEVRGSALVSSKEVVGGRDDLNIETQKDMNDAITALIREMKFGSPRPDTDSALLPTNFSSTRWPDSAGGIQGARAQTVTIGDGVSTWGDFNGTDETPFQEAVDFIAASAAGSVATVVVKPGAYVFTQAVSTTSASSISWVGEGIVSLSLDSGTDALFNMTNAAEWRASNISFAKTGANASLVILSGLERFAMDRCTVTGGQLHLTGTGTSASFEVTRCTLNMTAVTTGVRAVELNSFFFTMVEDCRIDISGGSHGFEYVDSSTTNVVSRCTVDLQDSAVSAFTFTGAQHDIINFQNCFMNALAGGGNFIMFPDASIAERMWVTNSAFLTADPLDVSFRSRIQLGAVLSGAVFSNVVTVGESTTPTTQGTISWGYSDIAQVSTPNITFTNMQMLGRTAGMGSHIFSSTDVALANRYSVTVRDSHFRGGTYGVHVSRSGSLTVDNCEFDGKGSLQNMTSAVVGGCRSNTASSTQDVRVLNSRFYDIDSVSTTLHSAITVTGPSVDTNTFRTNVLVEGNSIKAIGNSTTSVVTIPIAVTTLAALASCQILNNQVSQVLATPTTGSMAGISVDGFYPTPVSPNGYRVRVEGNEVSGLGAAASTYVLTAGIQLSSATLVQSIKISGNNLRGLLQTNASLGAIYVSCTTDILDCKIVDNEVTQWGSVADTPLGGFNIAVVTDTATNLMIRGNSISNLASSAVAGIGVTLGAVGSVSYGVRISDNQIDMAESGVGVQVTGQTSGVGSNHTIADLSIDNNHIYNMSYDFDASTTYGIYVATLTAIGLSVQGNSIHELVGHASRMGILVLLNSVDVDSILSKDIMLANNKISFVSGTARTPYMVSLTSASFFTVTGNILSVRNDNNSALAAPGMLIGTCKYGFVHGNFIHGGVGSVELSLSGSKNLAASNNLLSGSATTVTSITAGGTNTHASTVAAGSGTDNISNLA